MLREIATFVRRHWPHLLLMVPGVFIVTIVHESAHALAVLVQGGTVTHFVWLPSVGKWGFITYLFPIGRPYSAFFISLAPYYLWLLLACFAITLSLRRRSLSYWRASLVYFWLFVVPLADVANASLPYLAYKDNDFYSAFGAPSSITAWLTLLACMFAIICGYFLQKRLYRADQLSVPSYLILSAAAIVAMVVFSVFAPLV